MSMSIMTLTFLVGLALIVVAIVGGGIEIKEVKIPPLPIVPRTLSFVVGCILLAVCVLYPQIFPDQESSTVPKIAEKAPAPNVADKAPTALPTAPNEQPWLGAAIKNHLITVRDVKVVLRHDGKYVGPIDDQPDDYFRQAVAAFQVSRNIKADGYVGPETYAKLIESWPEYFPNK